MIGRTISHYKILEKLGEGGRGVVYKAKDTKLKRTVALKFLSPQALGSKKERSRFVHEAQAAAALDHSNICTIHEISEVEGKSFITMAYVDGPSLSEQVELGPLDVARVVDIAIQVAEGLRVAHEKGIIHRDIKSANIMLTSKGQAKITDFGLAKLPGRTKLTKTGATIGTLAYMSPEQARGDEVDHRTDIWSLGVVLYELLSGRSPFKGDHEAAMVYSILNEEAAPLKDLAPRVPAEFESIVAKMLQKSPDDRYASTEELLSDLRKMQSGAAVKVALPMSRKARRALWGLSAVLVIAAVVSSVIILNRRPATVSARTLAVVAFDIIGGEDSPHLAEGLAEGISAKLSKLQGVRVVSSDDIRRLRKKDLSAKDVASQMGAQFALGGSLLRTGEQIRVTPQLIDASTGDVIWSEPFDREFSNVLDFLDEVSLRIAEVLKIELNPADIVALEEKPTESAEGYEHYLKGRHYYYRVTVRDNELAVKEFQKALKLDPGYPLALAGLADAYVQRYKERYDYDEYWLDEADRLIEGALEIENDLAEAYESRSEVLLEKENLLAALEAAQNARDLHPEWDEPYLRLGEIYQKRGEAGLAMEMYERALAIRLSVRALCGKGEILYMRGEVDSAFIAFRAALEHDPHNEYPYYEIGRHYRDLRRVTEADSMLRLAIKIRPDHALSYSELSWLIYHEGRIQEARELVRGFVDRYPYNWLAYNRLYDIVAWGIGDYHTGMAIAEEAVARNPDRVWPHLLLALSHAWQMSESADPVQAVASLKRALTLRPGSSRVLQQAGQIHGHMGDIEKALEYYHRAVELNPGGVSILNEMAEQLFLAGRYHEATSTALKAREQAPGVVVAIGLDSYKILSRTMYRLNRADEYLSILQSATDKYGPDNLLFYVYLGDEQCKRGDFTEAISSYKRALEIKEDEYALRGLGSAQWLSGNTDAAMSSYIRAREIAPSLIERFLIALLKYLGKHNEIEKRLEAVRASGKIDTWFWLAGDYYASMRRFDDAIRLGKEISESAEVSWKSVMPEIMGTWHRKSGDLAGALKLLEEAQAVVAPAFYPGLYHHRAVIAAIRGRPDEAEEFARAAIEGEREYYKQEKYLTFLARLLFAGGRTDEALDALEQIRGVSLSRLAALYTAAQLKEESESPDAEDAVERVFFLATRFARSPDLLRILSAEARGYCARASARLGDTSRAREEIAYALKYEPERADIAYCAACAYSLVGDTEEALGWLQTAVDRGHQELWWARVDPDLDNLRGLPRFKEILYEWDRRIEALIH